MKWIKNNKDPLINAVLFAILIAACITLGMHL